MTLRCDTEKAVLSYLLGKYADCQSEISIHEICGLLNVDFGRADLAEEMMDTMVRIGVLEPNLPLRSMMIVGAKPDGSYRILPAICERQDAIHNEPQLCSAASLEPVDPYLAIPEDTPTDQPT